jgi:hypothetical protein
MGISARDDPAGMVSRGDWASPPSPCNSTWTSSVATAGLPFSPVSSTVRDDDWPACRATAGTPRTIRDGGSPAAAATAGIIRAASSRSHPRRFHAGVRTLSGMSSFMADLFLDSLKSIVLEAIEEFGLRARRFWSLSGTLPPRL